MHRYALFALLLTACASPTRVPTDADGPKLRVMTYNVNYGTAGDEATLQAIRDGDADVVFLQETTSKPSSQRPTRTVSTITAAARAASPCCRDSR